MQTEPFSGYLDYFSHSYRDEEVSRKDLVELFFPIPIKFLDRHRTGNGGPRRITRNGRIFYNTQELIAFARMHSIPNEGYCSREPIRHAEILQLFPDRILPNGKDGALIATVTVAAAFMQIHDARRGKGQLVFVCPFCGCTHFHGAGGLRFGDGDGHREKHCICRAPAYLRHDTQDIARRLCPGWNFNLVEVEDFHRAGEFPRGILKHLANRAEWATGQI